MTTTTTMIGAPLPALAAALGIPLLAAVAVALWWILRGGRQRANARHVGESRARSALKTRVLSLARPHSRSAEAAPPGEPSHPAQSGSWLRHVAPPGRPDNNDRPARSVLIADDDVYVNHWLSVRLGKLGLHVIATTDATNALLGAERFRPDLIVLDVNMPTGSGAAVCELLATNDEFRDVPVIMYTAVADPKTQFRCRSFGARYVMKEPGSWNRLRSVVCELLDLPAAHEIDCLDAGQPLPSVGLVARESRAAPRASGAPRATAAAASPVA